jgi:hypothetical protein
MVQLESWEKLEPKEIQELQGRLGFRASRAKPEFRVRQVSKEKQELLERQESRVYRV